MPGSDISTVLICLGLVLCFGLGMISGGQR